MRNMVLMILDVQNALIQAYPYNEQNVIDNMNKRIACICQTATRYRDSMENKALHEYGACERIGFSEPVGYHSRLSTGYSSPIIPAIFFAMSRSYTC